MKFSFYSIPLTPESHTRFSIETNYNIVLECSWETQSQ